MLVAFTMLIQSQTMYADSTSAIVEGDRGIVSLGAFEFTIPQDWHHRTSSSENSTSTILTPDGLGTLKLKSMTLPGEITPKNLRNLTNVESSTLLDWQSWGDLDGYHYDYIENGTFHQVFQK